MIFVGIIIPAMSLPQIGEEHCFLIDTTSIDSSKKSSIFSKWKIFESGTRNNTYVIEKSCHTTIIHNKKAKYYDKPVKYNDKYIFHPLPRFALVNEAGLREELKKIVVPLLTKELLTLGNRFCLEFRMNLQGKIEEVYFIYPTKLPLSLEAIEQLESYVLKHCAVQFEVNKLLEGVDIVKWTKEFQLFELYGLNAPISYPVKE